MAVQSVTCGSCGAGVPYGRLSCPACGDLLASVAGGRRPSVVRSSVVDSSDSADLGALVDDLDAEATFTDVASPLAAAAAAAVASPAAPPPPGAYIPPRPTPVAPVPPVAAAVALPGGGTPAGPAAPARAWAGRPADAAVAAAAGSAAAKDSPTSADTARLAEAAGWLAIAGAALAGVGFLMPWSVTVIGSQGTGYFDRWGLAGPGHLLLAVAVVGILAVNVLDQVTSRIPVWLRAGIPGLGIGALLLGLVWPYVLGPLGADPGAVAVTVGAFVLVVGGIVGIAADRHAEAA